MGKTSDGDIHQRYYGLTSNPGGAAGYRGLFWRYLTKNEITLVRGSASHPYWVYARYETGARYNEAERLEWTDIDPERCKTTIRSSKHGKARTLTVSRDLIGKLLSLPKVEKTVFPRRARNTRRLSFSRRMKRLARAHNNPRLAKIHYHTFRHCKALREYHKTRSILHVKRVLGHRSILTTQRYVELYTEVYGDLMPEDYVCETASTVEEAKKLIESGFEYVSTINGEQLYRKVK